MKEKEGFPHTCRLAYTYDYNIIKLTSNRQSSTPLSPAISFHSLSVLFTLCAKGGTCHSDLVWLR